MRVQVLSSGSKGNLLHLHSGSTRLLVDAGISCKQIEGRMRLAQLNPQHLDAILVTHEHSDHIRGISVLSRRYNIPVWVCRKAWDHVSRTNPGWHNVTIFNPGISFALGDLEVHPFSIPHDTSDPVAFCFKSASYKFAMATDLGSTPDSVISILAKSDLLLLESNHDMDMLMNGPYPWFLKRRISSRHGHLSNDQCAELIQQLIHPGLKAVILAHLSETNNRPELALKKTADVLNAAEMNIPLIVADQHKPSSAIEL